MSTLEPGQSFGHYTIVSRLAADEAGLLYRAYDSGAASDVLLRVLPAALAQSAGFEARFQALGVSLRKLTHANILRVLETGIADGAPYIAMPVVEAVPLAERIAGGQVAPAQADKLIAQVASAVQYAHDNGVAHGALNPAHILVDGSGNALVTDFGLAALGAGQAAPDPRADVTALGGVLLSLLTGKPAMPDSAALADALGPLTTTQPLDRRDAVSAAYARVIAKLSAADVGGFDSARAFLDEWQAAGSRPAAPPLARPDAASRPAAGSRPAAPPLARPDAVSRPAAGSQPAVPPLARPDAASRPAAGSRPAAPAGGAPGGAVSAGPGLAALDTSSGRGGTASAPPGSTPAMAASTAPPTAPPSFVPPIVPPSVPADAPATRPGTGTAVSTAAQDLAQARARARQIMEEAQAKKKAAADEARAKADAAADEARAKADAAMQQGKADADAARTQADTAAQQAKGDAEFAQAQARDTAARAPGAPPAARDTLRSALEISQRIARGTPDPARRAALEKIIEDIRAIGEQRAAGTLSDEAAHTAITDLVRQVRALETQTAPAVRDAAQVAAGAALSQARTAAPAMGRAVQSGAAAAARPVVNRARPVVAIVAVIVLVLCAGSLILCAALGSLTSDATPTPRATATALLTRAAPAPTARAGANAGTPGANGAPTLAAPVVIAVTPSATAAPLQTKVVFTDTFAAGSCNLPEGDDARRVLKCDRNEYVMLVKPSVARWVYYDSPEFQDIVIDFDARAIASAPTMQYGVIWRVSSDGNSYYGFTLTPSGQAAVFVYKDSNFSYFIEGVTISNFRTGGNLNHVTITANGPDLAFAINGETLAVTLSDTTLSSGTVGFIVDSSAPNAQASFSNLVVSEIQ